MQKRTFTGRYENLSEVEEFLSPLMDEVGFSDAQKYNLRLAVDEACTNIIEHAYRGEEHGKIVCAAERTGDGLKITIKDWGKSFDPQKIPEPDFDVPLENLTMRGAGLYLIKELMDEFHFDSDPEDGNKLVIVKYK